MLTLEPVLSFHISDRPKSTSKISPALRADVICVSISIFRGEHKWNRVHVSTSLVLLVISQPLSPVHQLPFLLKGLKGTTLLKSWVLVPHTSSDFLRPIANNMLLNNTAFRTFTATSYEPSFRLDTFILHHHPLDQSTLDVIVRASWKESSAWTIL